MTDEQAIRSLLEPLAEIEPVRRHPRPVRRRGLAYAGAAVAALALGGAAATAAGVGPLAGIGAADRPRAARDVIPSASADQLQPHGVPSWDQIGARNTGSSRLVGRLPAGRKVFVVPTAKGRLCVAVEGLAQSCSEPLSQAAPTTLTIVDADGPGGTPQVAYAVARDGVTAVTFDAGGQRVTVPVANNFWAYEGSADFSSTRVVLEDGAEVSLP